MSTTSESSSLKDWPPAADATSRGENQEPELLINGASRTGLAFAFFAVFSAAHALRE